jgi:hypothetical protein
MHICRLRSRPENHSDPTIRLNGHTSTDKDRALYALFSLEPKKSASSWRLTSRTPWITNIDNYIDTTLLTLSKGSSMLRIRAELGNNLEYELPELPKKWGRAVVTPPEIREIQLQSPYSIFNAEAEAVINTAIKMTRTSEQSKRLILSDSLSCLTALNGNEKN